MFDPEYEKYILYIEQYYPETGMKNDSTLKNIHYSISKNISFMKLIQKVDSTLNQERKRLYEDFYLIQLRVLYHLPSNDEFVNNILVRLVTENILRLVVSFINPRCVSISAMSYSKMLEELESRGFSNRYPSFYQKITNYFGKYSQDVHGETIHKYSESEYLLMIRKKENSTSSKSLLRVYSSITDEIIPFFLKESSIEKTKVETPILSEMLKIVGEDTYYKFF